MKCVARDEFCTNIISHSKFQLKKIFILILRCRGARDLKSVARHKLCALLRKVQAPCHHCQLLYWLIISIVAGIGVNIYIDFTIY